MSDQLGEDVPSETARAWDSARRVREPIAWTLLVLTAIGVLISVWVLFGLPGAPVPIAGPTPVPVTGPTPVPITGPSPVPVTNFGLRASVVAPQFVALGYVALPVLSVVLVAFAGGLTDRARQVVQTAVTIQALALGLGLLSWLGALGAHTRPGIWFIAVATDLAVAAAALVFTVAVIRSQALRPLTSQLKDFGEDDEDFGGDA
jgi:hypothetical protein